MNVLQRKRMLAPMLILSLGLTATACGEANNHTIAPPTKAASNPSPSPDAVFSNGSVKVTYFANGTRQIEPNASSADFPLIMPVFQYCFDDAIYSQTERQGGSTGGVTIDRSPQAQQECRDGKLTPFDGVPSS